MHDDMNYFEFGHAELRAES